jgi:hypothetical protein
MIGNLLAYEVFRRTTGVLPAETENHLLIQDVDSLDTAAEPLLPHPRCPHCATGAAASESESADAERQVRLGELHDTSQVPVATEAASPLGGPVTDGVGEEDAAQAALAEITDRAVLVQPRTGVFQAYADEEWAQTPLKVSTVVLGTGHRTRRDITAFDVHHVAGARLRALYRAAEVYAEHVVPVRQALAGPELDAARGKWPSVDPAALSIAGGLGTAAGLIPRWCAATSLLSGETLLVPAAAVRPFGPDNRERIVEATSAGTGAGGTAAEAATRGVLTALAHDTLCRALRGTLAVHRVPTQELTGEDAELTFLARSAAGLGVDLEILDLGASEERALPVVLARAADPATGRWRWAAAGGRRWRDAALDAVRDLLGAVQVGGSPDTGDPLLADLDAATVLVTDEVRPASAAPTDWPTVAARLRATGHDLLTVPTPAPDLAAGRIHTARVLLTTPTARP